MGAFFRSTDGIHLLAEREGITVKEDLIMTKRIGRERWSNESGQGVTEYAILVATLALGAIVVLTTVASRWNSGSAAPAAATE